MKESKPRHLNNAQTLILDKPVNAELHRCYTCVTPSCRVATPMTLNALREAVATAHRAGRLDEALLGAIELAKNCEQVGDMQGEALALHTQGTILMDMERADEAIPPLRRATDIFEQAGPSNHSNFVTALKTTAEAFAQCGALEEAEMLLTAAYKQCESVKPATDEDAHWWNHLWGCILLDLGEISFSRGNTEFSHECIAASQQLFETLPDTGEWKPIRAQAVSQIKAAKLWPS